MAHWTFFVSYFNKLSSPFTEHKHQHLCTRWVKWYRKIRLFHINSFCICKNVELYVHNTFNLVTIQWNLKTWDFSLSPVLHFIQSEPPWKSGLNAIYIQKWIAFYKNSTNNKNRNLLSLDTCPLGDTTDQDVAFGKNCSEIASDLPHLCLNDTINGTWCCESCRNVNTDTTGGTNPKQLVIPNLQKLSLFLYFIYIMQHWNFEICTRTFKEPIEVACSFSVKKQTEMYSLSFNDRHSIENHQMQT